MIKEKILQKIIKKHGFEGIKIFLRHTDKNSIFVVTKGQKKYFVKATLEPEKFDNLVNEVEANRFIRKIQTKNLPLYIPKSELIKEEDYCLAIFEYLSGGSMADQDSLKIMTSVNKSDFEKLYQIAAFYLQIKEEEIPSCFKKKAKMFTFENYQKRMDEYLERPLGKLIDLSEKRKLLENMKEIGYRCCFQHHDYVLWNMFRRNNKIVVADAEFSRWEMKWYDISYFFIQTYIYLESPELAKEFLVYILDRFKTEFPNEEIEKEIFFPMNYRITANLNEALGNKKQEKLARELLEKIITRDISKTLE